MPNQIDQRGTITTAVKEFDLVERVVHLAKGGQP